MNEGRAIERILVFLIAPFFLACSSSEYTSRAELEVANFHKRFNAGIFQEIYDLASDDFKQSARKEEMVKFFENVRDKLGEVKDTQRTGWHVDYNTSGALVTLTCETQFSKGKAIEVFVYRVAGQNMILAGYRIDG